MRIRRVPCSVLVGTSLLLACGAGSGAAQATLQFRNNKVRVMKEVLAAGMREPLVVLHPSVVVYMEGSSAEMDLTDGTKRHIDVARGKTEEEPAVTGSLVNSGSDRLVLVRVEFLTGGSDATWGPSGLAPNYKVLIEDRYSRTYDIRMPAHGSEPQHTHHDRVVVCLSGAQLEHILPDGSRQASTLKTDEIGWRPGQTHVGHNLGDTDLWVIAIEPK
jgi:hypothetical protein